MPSPGATINTSVSASTATPGQRLGTFFVAAMTQRGPLYPTPAAPMRSISDYEAVYGTRDATVGSAATTYDMLEAFWRSNGGPVHISRVVGPAAVISTLTLMDRAGSPLSTLTVKAKGPGAWANTHLTVQIANGVATNTFVVKVFVDTVLAEQSPDLASPTEAATWSALSQLVNITDLASATVAPNNNPAVLAATALATGADDLASVTDTHWTTALTNGFPLSMGPGMVAKLGITTAAGHAGTVTHAQANNRLALLDGPRSASQATLTTLAATVAAAAGSSPEYGMVFGPWVVIPPVAGGRSNRVIPSSAVAAGLISAQVTDGSANTAAAGARGQALYVLDADQTFTQTELDTLNGTACVAVFRRAYSASSTPPVELYGYNTLGSLGNGWRQASSQLLRLQIVDEMKLLAEQFVFSQIDGRGHKIAEFGGAAAGILLNHYALDELYGETAAEAFDVDVATVNTPTTVAAGELNARIRVRVSPYAEFVTIDLVKIPVSQTL